jgi:hypothetical protein
MRWLLGTEILIWVLDTTSPRLVLSAPSAVGVAYDHGVDQDGDDLPAAGGKARNEVPFAQRLDAWVADARIDAAAEQRSRERWLRSAAEQDATFAGVLLDLAERGGSVSVQAGTGRRHHGVIGVIGADFFALRTPAGREVLLARRSVAQVRADPLEVATGERSVTTDLCLADVLSQLAADRARVVLVTHGAEGIAAGELRRVGIDVATVRTEGDPPGMVYVPIDSISEVGLG